MADISIIDSIFGTSQSKETLLKRCWIIAWHVAFVNLVREFYGEKPRKSFRALEWNVSVCQSHLAYTARNAAFYRNEASQKRAKQVE